MLLRDFLRLIENEFPVDTAIEGDPVGLQVQAGRFDASSVLVALEITDEVVDEARRRETNCIVTFHPFIYRPMRAITESDRTGRLATKLIRNEIAVIAIHTNFDAHPRGSNTLFGQKLGLRDAEPLAPDARRAGFGMGVAGYLSEALAPEELADLTSGICGAPVVFAPKIGQTKIRKVAVVCGSGFSFFDRVAASKADAFITADVKYHGYHASSEQFTIIAPGHYEMERFVPDGLANELRAVVGDEITVSVAETVTNPLRYAGGKNPAAYA